MKILALFKRRREMFYIGGSDTLPPPLDKDEEQKCIAMLKEGSEDVQGTRLVDHDYCYMGAGPE